MDNPLYTSSNGSNDGPNILQLDRLEEDFGQLFGGRKHSLDDCDMALYRKHRRIGSIGMLGSGNIPDEFLLEMKRQLDAEDEGAAMSSSGGDSAGGRDNFFADSPGDQPLFFRSDFLSSPNMPRSQMAAQLFGDMTSLSQASPGSPPGDHGGRSGAQTTLLPPPPPMTPAEASAPQQMAPSSVSVPLRGQRRSMLSPHRRASPSLGEELAAVGHAAAAGRPAVVDFYAEETTPMTSPEAMSPAGSPHNAGGSPGSSNGGGGGGSGGEVAMGSGVLLHNGGSTRVYGSGGVQRAPPPRGHFSFGRDLPPGHSRKGSGGEVYLSGCAESGVAADPAAYGAPAGYGGIANGGGGVTYNGGGGSSGYGNDGGEGEDGDVDEEGGGDVEVEGGRRPTRWMPDEDERLATAVRDHGEVNWKSIARLVGTKDHTQCLQRWKRVLHPGLKKGRWMSTEDARLVALVSQGFKNWVDLAKQMPGRTSKQCRERWCHHLDPNVKKGDYSEAEDCLILEMQYRLGNRWAQIAQMLPGRTENAVKIRWKAIQRCRMNAQQGRVSNQPLVRARKTSDKGLRPLAAYALATSMGRSPQPTPGTAGNSPSAAGPLSYQEGGAGGGALVDAHGQVVWDESSASYSDGDGGLGGGNSGSGGGSSAGCNGGSSERNGRNGGAEEDAMSTSSPHTPPSTPSHAPTTVGWSPPSAPSPAGAPAGSGYAGPPPPALLHPHAVEEEQHRLFVQYQQRRAQEQAAMQSGLHGELRQRRAAELQQLVLQQQYLQQVAQQKQMQQQMQQQQKQQVQQQQKQQHGKDGIDDDEDDDEIVEQMALEEEAVEVAAAANGQGWPAAAAARSLPLQPPLQAPPLPPMPLPESPLLTTALPLSKLPRAESTVLAAGPQLVPFSGAAVPVETVRQILSAGLMATAAETVLAGGGRTAAAAVINI